MIVCPCVVRDIRSVLAVFYIPFMFLSPCFKCSSCLANVAPQAISAVCRVNYIGLVFWQWSVFDRREHLFKCAKRFCGDSDVIRFQESFEWFGLSLLYREGWHSCNYSSVLQHQRTCVPALQVVALNPITFYLLNEFLGISI